MNKDGQQTDEQLIELCRGGDDDAFKELMGRYLKSIYGFIRSYVHAKDDADDIAQDTFLKAWKSVRKFKPEYTFKAWIYTIARNTALDHIKKKRTYAFSELEGSDDEPSFAETIKDDTPLAPEMLDLLESTEELTSLLNSLHPDHRSVLILHYYEELTFEEIAVIMKRPMNTVKSWHRRAIERIRISAPNTTPES